MCINAAEAPINFAAGYIRYDASVGIPKYTFSISSTPAPSDATSLRYLHQNLLIITPALNKNLKTHHRRPNSVLTPPQPHEQPPGLNKPKLPISCININKPPIVNVRKGLSQTCIPPKHKIKIVPEW